MNLSVIQNNIIKKILETNSQKKIFERGEELFNFEAVELISHSNDYNRWHFKVYGSIPYKVVFTDLFNHKKLQSCTCPYDWGGICKHQVAALLFVDNYISEKKLFVDTSGSLTNTKSPTRDKLGLGFDNFNQLIDKLGLNNTSNLFNFSNNNSTLKLSSLEADQVIFKISSIYSKDKFLQFKYTNNKFYFTEKPLPQNINFTNTETLVVFKLYHCGAIGQLESLLSTGYIHPPHSIEDIYGFNKETIDKLFNLSFSDERGFEYIPKDKNSILLTKKDSIEEFVDFSNSNFDPNELLVQDAQIVENRGIGFALKSVYSSKYQTENIAIIPFTANLNKQKNKLLSKFEYLRLEDVEHHLNDNQKELLKITLTDEEIVCHPTSHAKIKKLFNLLSNENFVFQYIDPNDSLKKNNLKELAISEDILTVEYHTESDKELIKLVPYVKVNKELHSIKNVEKQISTLIFEIDNKYFLCKNYNMAQLYKQSNRVIQMPIAHKEAFYHKVIKPFAKHAEIVFKDSEYHAEINKLDFKSKQIYLSENGQYLVITPQVAYDNDVNIKLSSNGTILTENEDQIVKFHRNKDLEDTYLEDIVDLHPKFIEQINYGIFFLNYKEFIQETWFFSFFDKLKQQGVEVFGISNLKRFKYNTNPADVIANVESGQDWFELDLKLCYGNNIVRLADIKKAVLNEEKYIKLEDETIGIIPDEWFEKFKRFFVNGNINENKLEISKLKFNFIYDMFADDTPEEIAKEIAYKTNLIKQFKEIKTTKVSDNIKADLRDYQKEGLNWLNFLDEMNWGGILADDMGLGKTLQIISFLQQQIDKCHNTNLVVVPTSLLFNWEAELNKFAPSLKAMYYYGTNRDKDIDQFDNYHIIFTTYGTLIKDIEILGEYHFNYVILDESQAIKNPASRRYKASCMLSANNKIAMSGTPIENNTYDLFAQMNFVNSCFLGNINTFKEYFSNEIDKEGNEKVARELSKMVKPFILRRTKEQVEKDLPEKTETIIYCEMSPNQRKIYEAYRNDYRDRLLGKVEEDGIGKTKLIVLEALNKLRLICDSPELLKDEEIKEKDSVKIDELVEDIDQKTSNHKILVFSQYVGMLDLIKKRLDNKGIDYEYLDGSTPIKRRKISVDNFQSNRKLRVFLISLKAGGTGLNLTAADYVYIVDPWWNPATESQAIDRCHRIGQDKKVFAYKMICKNTIEEKILELQSKKKKIASDIIQSEESIMKSLTVDDIKDLFG
jgi:SNF2 family DNA or RNA helicase